MGLQNQETCNEELFCYTEIHYAQYFLLNHSISLHFLFLVFHLGNDSGIFEFLTKFPFAKCIHSYQGVMPI